MIRFYFSIILLAVSFINTSYASNSLISTKSSHSVAETADRLENILKSKNMTVFARIDHAAGAEKAGLELRPTELLIFGNPKVGTPLMNCSQSIAIDLPQKALIWQDKDGVVWLGYNNPDYIAQRHAVTSCDEVLAKVKGALAKFVTAATSE